MPCTLSRFVRTIFAALLLFATLIQAGNSQAQGYDSLVLLLPDAQSVTDPRVVAWLDATQEEGLKLKLMYDSEFLQMGTAGALKYRGFILPDQVHQTASDTLINAVQDYVAQGGKLMLVYDAGALTPSGFYATTKSRFSALAGVDYVLYDELRDFTVGWSPVSGMERRMWQLQVPPGKSMPFPAATSTAAQALYLPSSASDPGGLKGYDHSYYHKLKHETRQNGWDMEKPSKPIFGPWRGEGSRYKPVPTTPTDEIHAVSGYVYGFLSYPSYVTRGSYNGEVILTSPNLGLVAGLSAYGNGKVLFVNLPLSYLKGQTDGMLMHGFLRYFGADLLKMPRLSNHPNGRGGLVLNWHVDSDEAINPMAQLARQGAWDEGPFSIHFTAGPDTISFGDGLGLNVRGNPLTQRWIKYFDDKGHQVGSHGGWIHDYFGLNANETNQAEFEKYLVWNKAAIEAVLGHPITEYSATEGNNPKWAMNWLEQNGFVGYYFTGHTGMGPTRTYREGQLMNPGLWAFPVTPFGQYATFEEFAAYGVSATAVTDWLTKLVDFSVQNRTSRLIYFHPPGAVQFPEVVKTLLDRARGYKAPDEGYSGTSSYGSWGMSYDSQRTSYGSGKYFEWYTMTRLARFNSQRMQVSWKVANLSDGRKRFEASHPSSLARQTWILPKAAFSRPYIEQGEAQVSDDPENWLVTAKSGATLKFITQPGTF